MIRSTAPNGITTSFSVPFNPKKVVELYSNDCSNYFVVKNDERVRLYLSDGSVEDWGVKTARDFFKGMMQTGRYNFRVIHG